MRKVSDLNIHGGASAIIQSAILFGETLPSVLSYLLPLPLPGLLPPVLVLSWPDVLVDEAVEPNVLDVLVAVEVSSW